MKKRFAKGVALILVVVLLGAVPGAMGGCGGAGKSTTIIRIGVEGDFTGPAGQTIGEMYLGMTDSLKDSEANNPIPGVRIKYVSYDDRLDYARIPVGYEWLKGQGAVLDLFMIPDSLTLLQDKIQRDRMPCFTWSVDEPILDKDYSYGWAGPWGWEATTYLTWLLNDYWPAQQAGRPPKLGYLGMTGYSSSSVYRDAIHAYLDAHPGSFELVQTDSPMGATAFAVEIQKLKGCDLIIVGMVGPSVPTFMKEARGRGWEGVFLGNGFSILGYWNQVRDAMSPEQIGRVFTTQNQVWWNTPGGLWGELEDTLKELHPDKYPSLRRAGTWGSGWTTTKIFVDVVRRAVAEVGAENVDSAAMNDAMRKLDMTFPGYGEAFQFGRGTIGTNVMYRMIVIREYRAAEDDWFAVSDWLAQSPE
jgi:hypothetical protein